MVPDPRRGGVTPLVFIILLILVGGMGWLVAGGRTQLPARAPDVASLLPERTIVHLDVTGAPCASAGKELALAQIFREPEVQRFLAPLCQLVSAQLEVAQAELRESTGLELDSLLALLKGRLTLTFVGLDRRGDQKSAVPDLVATLEFGEQVETVRSLLSAVEDLLQDLGGLAVEEVTVAGVPLRRFQSDEFQVLYGVHGSLLFVGTCPETLGEVLNRLKSGDSSGSLAAAPVFARAREMVRRPQSVIVAYADMKRFLELLLKEVPEETRDALTLYGLESFQAFGYGLDLDGPGLRDRIYMHVPEKRGWLAAQRPTGGKIKCHDFLPAETGFVSAGTIDFSALYDTMTDVLDRSYPKLAQDFRQGLGQMERKLGLRLRDDILAALGPEYAIFASWPGQSIIPDPGVLFQVTDRTRVENVLRTIEESLAGTLEVADLAFRGESIRYVELGSVLRSPSGAPGWLKKLHPRPSLALVGDYLVIALWPQSLKNLIDGLKKGSPRLAEKADFARILQHVKKENPAAGSAGISYLDLKAMAGFLLDNGIPLAQMLVPTLGDVPLDVAALPTTESITRHLFGMVSASHWTQEGAYADVYSPVGMAPVYGALMAGLGAALFLGVRVEEEYSPFPPSLLGQEEGPAPRDDSDRVRMQLMNLRMAVQLHLVMEGRLPREEEWPNFVFKGSEHHRRPYLDEEVFQDQRVVDPWGGLFIYRLLGSKSFEILSYGADGQPGGTGADADVSSGRVR